MSSCCLVTPGRVGKTSLVSRIIHNTFNDSQQATVQAAFTSKTLEVDRQQVQCTYIHLGNPCHRLGDALC